MNEKFSTLKNTILKMITCPFKDDGYCGDFRHYNYGSMFDYHCLIYNHCEIHGEEEDPSKITVEVFSDYFVHCFDEKN